MPGSQSRQLERGEEQPVNDGIAGELIDGTSWYVFDVTTHQAATGLRVELVNTAGTGYLAGDAVQRSKLQSTSEYTWDHRNRLTGVAIDSPNDGLDKDIAYRYDVLDRRIGKTIEFASHGNDIVERYVPDGQHVALHLDGDNAVTHRNLWSQAVDQLLAVDRVTEGTARTIWPLTDHQGTVRNLYGLSGGVYKVYAGMQYDSFGRPQADAFDIGYLYAGQQWDWETNLQYSRARYYDPQARQFISPDPIGFAAGDTNLYRRVGNSPVNATDPSGLANFWNPLTWGLDNPSQGWGGFFNPVSSENRAAAGGFFMGSLQGTANIANGVQDGVIGLANLPAFVWNVSAGNLGAWEAPYIASPDWSKGLFVHESDLAHNISKFAGGEGAITLATLGWGHAAKLRHLNKLKVGLVDDAADAARMARGVAPVGTANQAGLLTRTSRLFYDNRHFRREISPEYWGARGGRKATASTTGSSRSEQEYRKAFEMPGLI